MKIDELLGALRLPDDSVEVIWTCTNCGVQTADIIFEEGDQNICRECYDRFEANEPRNRGNL